MHGVFKAPHLHSFRRFTTFVRVPTLAKERGGDVYTLTNGAGGNQVAVFDRGNDGTLTADGTVSTGGLGTGAGLGSQGALAVEGRQLLAVNAGSNSVSLFSIDNDGDPNLEHVARSC